jgi:membrane protein DedA with SNARE-associated domain
MGFSYSDLVTQYGYLGIFIVSLLSNGTFLFPVPYLLVLYSVGATGIFNPILVAIVSGVGATIGELILYFLSMLGRTVLPLKYKSRVDSLKLILGKYGAVVIFIFALTPLPDDVIYPILGLMKYDVYKVFIACFLGKTLLSAGAVYAGYFSVKYFSILLGGESIYAGLISLILGIILAVIFLKLDWTKYFKVEGMDV